MKFQSYLTSNFKVTDNGFGYIVATDEMLKEFDVDAATARNMVNNFYYIDEIIAWAVFTVDSKNDSIRGSIRSRGPIINEIAIKFNGGGHKFASGVRLKSADDIDKIIQYLDETCAEFNKAKELN